MAFLHVDWQVQDAKHILQAGRRQLRYDRESDEYFETALPATQHATSRAVRSSWLFSRSAEEEEAKDGTR